MPLLVVPHPPHEKAEVDASGGSHVEVSYSLANQLPGGEDEGYVSQPPPTCDRTLPQLASVLWQARSTPPHVWKPFLQYPEYSWVRIAKAAARPSGAINVTCFVDIQFPRSPLTVAVISAPSKYTLSTALSAVNLHVTATSVTGGGGGGDGGAGGGGDGAGGGGGGGMVTELESTIWKPFIVCVWPQPQQLMVMTIRSPS